MLRKYQPKVLGLVGLVAALSMLAIASVGASSASALPELLWCMNNGASAKYETETKCENLDESGTGTLTWEWEDETLSGEVFELMFKSGAGLMTTAPGGLHIECTADTGSITKVILSGGIQLLSGGHVIFTGCIELAFGSSCNSPGAAAGEIITSNLDGELRYLKAGAKTPVGALLEPETGTTFTEIECLGGIIAEKVEGAVIGEVIPVNTEVTKGTLLFEENAGAQLWTKVEEAGTVYKLTAFGEPAVLVSEEEVTLLVAGKELNFIVDA